MGNVEVHDFTPAHNDERKELNLSRKVTYKQYKKHVAGEACEANLTDLPWQIKDSISLYERMDVSFNAITELPAELPLRLPHLNFINFNHNSLISLPESFGLLFHLKTLLLSHNKLRALPKSFTHLTKLEKLDISHNAIRDLPEELGRIECLTKINVCHNKLKTLPKSLYATRNLTVILATKNRLVNPPQSVANEGSKAIIGYFKKTAASELIQDKGWVGNVFPRVRCNQLHTSVSNLHSAQAQYIQHQTHTAHTASRIKTPLLPPVGATSLDVLDLRDQIIGLIYGAAIGDAIGIATRNLSKDECSFHYDFDTLSYKDIIRDQRRTPWKQGDWTDEFDQFALVLDSIIHWAGVIDELDFAKRLQDWSVKGFPELGDKEGLVFNTTLSKVVGSPKFLEDPHFAAEHISKQNDESGIGLNSCDLLDSQSDSSYVSHDSIRDQSNKSLPKSEKCDTYQYEDIYADNGCISRSQILGVPFFHDLTEVSANTVRICKATHANEMCVASTVLLSNIIAHILQAKDNIWTSEGVNKIIQESTNQALSYLSSEKHDDFMQWLSFQTYSSVDIQNHSKSYCVMIPLAASLVALRSQQTFRVAIANNVKEGGHSNINACVTGAVIGCKVGFSKLPTNWVEELRKKQTDWLNVKINLLLDMMGMP